MNGRIGIAGALLVLCLGCILLAVLIPMLLILRLLIGFAAAVLLIGAITGVILRADKGA